MPVYKGIEIFVADSQTKIVKGATDSRQIGVKLEGLVVSSDKKSGETDVRLIRIGGKRCKCLLSQYDDYIVAVTIDLSLIHISRRTIFRESMPSTVFSTFIS